jgi:hypothetical protein
MKDYTYDDLVIYHYQIYTGGPDPLDTKYCFSSHAKAIAKARTLKRDHLANKVRVENNDTMKVQWV